MIDSPTSIPRWVDEALDVIRADALRASEVDWEKVLPEVRAHAALRIDAGRPEQALDLAFRALDDCHSFLEAEPMVGFVAPPPRLPSGEIVDGVRTLDVPAFRAPTDSPEAHAYVAAGLAALRGIDFPGPVLLDLRANTGGNCFPMLAVVAPLVGVGELVSFRAPLRASETLGFDGSAITYNGEPRLQSGPVVQNTPPRIAVLIGATTASSGEVALLALRDREQVRTFGLPTAGLTTSNAGYPLADGFTLYLAVSVMHSSTGVACEGPIDPDVLAAPPNDVLRARGWLTAT